VVNSDPIRRIGSEGNFPLVHGKSKILAHRLRRLAL
jgi:hypothetical protein